MGKNNIRLSVVLNRAIENVGKENFNLFDVREKEEYLLYLQDSDPKTGFYFGITKETPNSSNDHVIQFTRKPGSSYVPTGITQEGRLEFFTKTLEEWFSNIQFYRQPSVLNDPIFDGYQNEFYNDFNLVDEDANYTPFTYDQQLLLDQFLEDVVNNIDEVRNERNSEIIDEIIADTLSLQAELTTETKNGFMKKLSGIFAKGRKAGLKVCKILLEEFAKEILKESTKRIFGFAIHNSGDISKYVKTIIHLS